MLRLHRIVCFLSLLMISGCDGADGVDAAIMDSGPRADAGASDGGRADAGARDAGRGRDAGDMDAGIDCSMIGCAPAPVCGVACTAPCGCCGCGSDSFCGADSAYTCAGGTCLLETECVGTDTCELGGGAVAECMGGCAPLRTAYFDAIEGGSSCAGGSACVVLDGHCGVGLGGCYYAANDAAIQTTLDSIAADWDALGCDEGAAVCDCPLPPVAATCVADACAFP